MNAVEDEFESESDYDSDDSEDKAYTNLLGASLREESDTDDDDFVCDVNGTSDLESELSEYSEHASDEELAVVCFPFCKKLTSFLTDFRNLL